MGTFFVLAGGFRRAQATTETPKSSNCVKPTIRNPQAYPTVWKHAVKMLEYTNPPIPPPDEMMPTAKLRRLENHSNPRCMQGDQTSDPATPDMTPIVRCSCHI